MSVDLFSSSRNINHTTTYMAFVLSLCGYSSDVLCVFAFLIFSFLDDSGRLCFVIVAFSGCFVILAFPVFI